MTRPPVTAPDERLTDIGDLARALGGDDTSFTGQLLRLVAKAQATPERLIPLACAFPREVRAYEVWMALGEPTTDELLADLNAYPQPAEPDALHLRDGWLAITYEQLGRMVVEAYQRGRAGGTITGPPSGWTGPT